MLSNVLGELYGNSAFNAQDRLAIMNLFGAYAQIYDAGRLDEWRTLFTDSVDMRFFAGGQPGGSSLADVFAALKARHEMFRANKDQRRHAFNSVLFTKQDGNEASGSVYFQVFSTQDGGTPSLRLTGYYDFTATKQDAEWKFSRWISHIDPAM